MQKDAAMSESQNCHLRAESARALANEAILPNVRARYLDAAAVWAQFAIRAERLEQMQSMPLDAKW